MSLADRDDGPAGAVGIIDRRSTTAHPRRQLLAGQSSMRVEDYAITPD